MLTNTKEEINNTKYLLRKFRQAEIAEHAV